MISETVTVDNIHYGRMTVPVKDNTVAKCIANNGIWEDYNKKLMEKYIKPNTTVIDCGAFVGSHTIFMSKISPDVDVLAIEMMPFHYQCLLSNIQANELSNVTPIHCCLTDSIKQHERLPLIDYSCVHNLGGTSLYMNRAPLRVETRTLDQIALQARKPISFIKMDIEGEEEGALNGAKMLLALHKPVILIELWKRQRELFPETPIYRYLTELGYTLTHHVGDDYLLIPK